MSGVSQLPYHLRCMTYFGIWLKMGVKLPFRSARTHGPEYPSNFPLPIISVSHLLKHGGAGLDMELPRHIWQWVSAFGVEVQTFVAEFAELS